MRVALIAAAAAIAVALFLTLSFRGGEAPVEPAPQAGTLAPAAEAAPETQPADEDAAPADEGAADVASAAEAERRAAAELVERYRAAAEAARERVSSLPQAARSGAADKAAFNPFRSPPPDAPPSMRKLWNEKIGALLYPAGHPRAGQPMDHVTDEQLAAAAAEMYNRNLPPDYLDAPVHPVRLHVNFRTFHRLKEQTGGGMAFARALEAHPPQPNVQVQDPYFIDTTWDDPDATTRGAVREQQYLEYARELREGTSGD